MGRRLVGRKVAQAVAPKLSKHLADVRVDGYNVYQAKGTHDYAKAELAKAGLDI